MTDPTTRADTDGYLITLEGIDGSGKTTILDRLQKSRIDWDGDIVFTREPTTSRIGNEIRSILAEDNADPWTELFLFMADHAQHVYDTIYPHLSRGALVISDRYIDSRTAYQATTISNDAIDVISFVENLHQPWSRFPDTTVYIDIPPHVGADRTTSGEKYETVDKLARIHDTYATLQDRHPDRFTVIDGEQPITDVVDAVTSSINTAINTH